MLDAPKRSDFRITRQRHGCDVTKQFSEDEPIVYVPETSPTPIGKWKRGCVGSPYLKRFTWFREDGTCIGEVLLLLPQMPKHIPDSPRCTNTALLEVQ